MVNLTREILFNGIDISSHQGVIDWEKVRDEIDFAIIRCGFGSDYADQDDALWENNVTACEKYGIPYGVYLYSYATTAEKARSEAAHVIRLLKGHRPDMPVFFDLEESRIAVLGNARILEISKIFCEAVTKAGYLYGTYANKNWFSNYLTDRWYDSYPKWIAQYNPEITYEGTYDIWQYTDSGSVNGIIGNVDMNYCYTSYIKGDVNGDGRITSADARQTLRAAAKLDVLSRTSEHTADVNSDGNVTAADAREILNSSAEVD